MIAAIISLGTPNSFSAFSNSGKNLCRKLTPLFIPYGLEAQKKLKAKANLFFSSRSP